LTLPFYKNRIYPHIVTLFGNPEPVQKIRHLLIPVAQRTVLEVGVGPGVNFPYYDASRVSKIYALEPNPGMKECADNQRRQTKLDVEFLDLPGERIPLADESVDTVVSTFTLCTIPGVTEAIKGIRRVLRPGGQFLFFELGLSPDKNVRRWQESTEPLFRWALAGGHVTRNIPALIEAGGFRVERMETGYLAPFPKAWSYYFWGVALPKP
jgi:SAM-dependent methyltransferase